MPSKESKQPSNVPIETVHRILYLVKKDHDKQLKVQMKRTSDAIQHRVDLQENVIRTLMHIDLSAKQLADMCNAEIGLCDELARYIHKHSTKKRAKAIWQHLGEEARQLFGIAWAIWTRDSDHAFDKEVATYLYRHNLGITRWTFTAANS